MKKVSIISDSILIATSGPVGLGQYFTEVVRSTWMDGKFKGVKPWRL